MDGITRLTRYLFKGKILDSGEWVVGQPVICRQKLFIVGNLVEACEEYCSPEYWYPVDPDTIEPLKIPVKHERTYAGDYRCPNCNVAFYGARWEQPSGIITKPKELTGTTPFCGNCGQALEWPDKEAFNDE